MAVKKIQTPGAAAQDDPKVEDQPQSNDQPSDQLEELKAENDRLKKELAAAKKTIVPKKEQLPLSPKMKLTEKGWTNG